MLDLLHPDQMLPTRPQGMMAFAPANWLEGNRIGIAHDHPKQVNVAFVNTYYPETVVAFPPAQWLTIDCSGFLPDDAKAVCLTTMLIITQGYYTGTCDLQIHLMRGDYAGDITGNYSGQTLCTAGSGGVRTNYSEWVALSADKKFKLKWLRTPGTSSQYPAGPAWGFNMNVAGYLAGDISE